MPICWGLGQQLALLSANLAQPGVCFGIGCYGLDPNNGLVDSRLQISATKHLATTSFEGQK
jgi:hypothetical protein